MRVLLTAHSGAGHIGPLLPFAGALRRAGADVMIAAPPRGRALVEGAGLRFWPFAEAPDERRDAIFSSLDGLTDEQMGARVIGECSHAWTGGPATPTWSPPATSGTPTC